MNHLKERKIKRNSRLGHTTRDYIGFVIKYKIREIFLVHRSGKKNE